MDHPHHDVPFIFLRLPFPWDLPYANRTRSRDRRVILISRSSHLDPGHGFSERISRDPCATSSGSQVWRAMERFPTWRNCESNAQGIHRCAYTGNETFFLKVFHRCSRRMVWLLSFSRLERIVVSRFTASRNFSLAGGMCFSGRPCVVKTFLTISESYILSRCSRVSWKV